MNRLFLVTALVALAPLAGARSSAAEPPGAAEVGGSWVLVSDEAELRAEVEAAIDRAVVGLPALFRPLARPSLRKTAVPCRTLELRVEADAVARSCDAEPPFRRLLDNSEPAIEGSDGHDYETTVLAGPDGVSFRFDGKRGGRTDHYTPGPDGSLLATATIHSKHLEAPMSWTVRYSRP